MTLEGAIRAAAKRGELIRDPQATLDELVQLRAEIARLTAERDAAIARAERAERLAVFAYRRSGDEMLRYNGTYVSALDPSELILAALRQAEEKG